MGGKLRVMRQPALQQQPRADACHSVRVRPVVDSHCLAHCHLRLDPTQFLHCFQFLRCEVRCGARLALPESSSRMDYTQPKKLRQLTPIVCLVRASVGQCHGTRNKTTPYLSLGT